MEYTEFLVFISIFLLAEIIGAQDKELLLQREKIARMNEIQIAMKRQGERMQDLSLIHI